MTDREVQHPLGPKREDERWEEACRRRLALIRDHKCPDCGELLGWRTMPEGGTFRKSLRCQIDTLGCINGHSCGQEWYRGVMSCVHDWQGPTHYKHPDHDPAICTCSLCGIDLLSYRALVDAYLGIVSLEE